MGWQHKLPSILRTVYSCNEPSAVPPWTFQECYSIGGKKVLALAINLIALALKCQKTNEPDNTDVFYLKFLHIP